MRVLVLGGMGFIGSHVTRQLLDDGHDVMVQDILPSAFAMQSHSLLSDAIEKRNKLLLNGAELVIGGPQEPHRFAQQLVGFDPEAVIYLVGMPIATVAEAQMTESRRQIFDLTASTIEALQIHGRVQRFVFVSSSMVYGEFKNEAVTEESTTLPVNTYGALKLAAETLVRTCIPNFGAKYTIIRPSAVYGPYDIHRRVVQIFCERAVRGLPITLQVPDDHRLDFTYVGDLAKGIVGAMGSPMGANQTFNLTTGKARSLSELAEILQHHFPNLKVARDIQLHRTAPKRGTLSIKKAQDCFGYSPEFTLETGIMSLLNSMQSTQRHEEAPV